MKQPTKISFVLLAIIIVILTIATLLEKIYGTEIVHQNIYTSVWMVALWGIMAVTSVVYLIAHKVHQKPAVIGIHAAFLLILIGAGITWGFGEEGQIHLRQGEKATAFQEKDGSQIALPFTLQLKAFQIQYYTGTPAPMDYESLITLNGGKEVKVSMNQQLDYQGYRFCQSSYDEDGKGTVLSISHDPIGIAVSYTGYGLMMLTMLLFFFSKKTRFYELLHNKSGLALLIICCYAGNCKADNTEVIPQNIAQKFGDIYVLYNDRVCPLQTLMKDFTLKLYGQPNYKGYTAEQVFTGFLFNYEDWKNEPIIKIKNKTVREKLGISGCYAQLSDYINHENGYKLANTEEDKTYNDANEKFYLIGSLYSGQMVKLFPHREGNTLEWYGQNDVLPVTMSNDEMLFITKAMDYAQELIIRKDYQKLGYLFDQIKSYQQKRGGNLLPGNRRMQMEKVYNQLHYTKQLAIVSIVIGILFFVYYSKKTAQNQSIKRKVKVGLNMGIGILITYLTITICLRGYVSQHLPLTNGYETMQFMALCTLLLTLSLQKRFTMIVPFGYLVSGLALMVSMIGESNPKITLLMPVLSSPLLSLHVVVIMTAYSLLAFNLLNGITAIGIRIGHKENKEAIRNLQRISEIILYPAVFLLATGIFIGAIWANQTWGKYWGWDPKEVWALISLLVYTFAFHSSSLRQFRNPMFFHIYMVVAFLTVLVTYFGVNYLLGGMHSYAQQ